MVKVCVDACFLIGLYDRDDQYHNAAVRHFGALFGEESARHQLVVPWPILYECLGTHYARDRRKSILFNQHWRYLDESGQIVLLDDSPFRESSLSDQLQDRSRVFSLVDRVLRAMIVSRKPLFDFFLTYNTGDFADACRNNGVPLINEQSSPDTYGY